jgi:hypothetical protein
VWHGTLLKEEAATKHQRVTKIYFCALSGTVWYKVRLVVGVYCTVGISWILLARSIRDESEARKHAREKSFCKNAKEEPLSSEAECRCV